jgi:hypothetical protein
MKRSGAAQRTGWVEFNGSTGFLVMSVALREECGKIDFSMKNL